MNPLNLLTCIASIYLAGIPSVMAENSNNSDNNNNNKKHDKNKKDKKNSKESDDNTNSAPSLLFNVTALISTVAALMY